MSFPIRRDRSKVLDTTLTELLFFLLLVFFLYVSQKAKDPPTATGFDQAGMPSGSAHGGDGETGGEGGQREGGEEGDGGVDEEDADPEGQEQGHDDGKRSGRGETGGSGEQGREPESRDATGLDEVENLHRGYGPIPCLVGDEGKPLPLLELWLLPTGIWVEPGPGADFTSSLFAVSDTARYELPREFTLAEFRVFGARFYSHGVDPATHDGECRYHVFLNTEKLGTSERASRMFIAAQAPINRHFLLANPEGVNEYSDRVSGMIEDLGLAEGQEPADEQ